MGVSMKKIEFINITTTPLDPPEPAKNSIPEWYKKHPGFLSDDGSAKPNGNGQSLATVKKCMPFFDSLTAGYIMSTAVDIHVTQTEEGVHYEWARLSYIQFHDILQVQEHPKLTNEMLVPKIHSAWGIRTPKGYSTLVLAPMHRKSPISIMPAIVDTDTYNFAIEFPFVLTDPKFTGLIPAGTEFAQLIPFKRDNFSMETTTDVSFAQEKTYLLRKYFYNAYRNNYWFRKIYK